MSQQPALEPTLIVQPLGGIDETLDCVAIGKGDLSKAEGVSVFELGSISRLLGKVATSQFADPIWGLYQFFGIFGVIGNIYQPGKITILTVTPPTTKVPPYDSPPTTLPTDGGGTYPPLTPIFIPTTPVDFPTPPADPHAPISPPAHYPGEFPGALPTSWTIYHGDHAPVVLVSGPYAPSASGYVAPHRNPPPQRDTYPTHETVTINPRGWFDDFTQTTEDVYTGAAELARVSWPPQYQTDPAYAGYGFLYFDYWRAQKGNIYANYSEGTVDFTGYTTGNTKRIILQGSATLSQADGSSATVDIAYDLTAYRGTIATLRFFSPDGAIWSYQSEGGWHAYMMMSQTLDTLRIFPRH